MKRTKAPVVVERAARFLIVGPGFQLFLIAVLAVGLPVGRKFRLDLVADRVP